MNIDWQNLPFGYMPSDYNVRCYYRNGNWGELEITSDEYIPMHMAATALHYGQESFEGMKAYMGKDRKIRLFRWEENARRMQRSARGIKLAIVPEDLFHDAVYAIMPQDDDHPSAVRTVDNLALTLGATPLYMDPVEHDAVLVMASTLPALLSTVFFPDQF